MSPTDIEIERALAAIATTLNHHQVDEFDAARIQQIVDDATGGERRLAVDDEGGLHDSTAHRIGTIRRTPSGEWIAERQIRAIADPLDVV